MIAFLLCHAYSCVSYCTRHIYGLCQSTMCFQQILLKQSLRQSHQKVGSQSSTVTTSTHLLVANDFPHFSGEFIEAKELASAESACDRRPVWKGRGRRGTGGAVSGWFIVGIVGLEGIIDLDGPWAAMGVVEQLTAVTALFEPLNREIFQLLSN